MMIDEWKKNLKDSMLEELNKMSSDELKEAFSGELEFGTGGIRAIMGVGPSRLNIYTIRKISLGLGRYLIKKYKENISVVLSHDNRFNSREFAFESVKVLGTLGIKCFMFEGLRPTPMLSYAVRYLGCKAGVMITASHNPKEYNGYKVYDESGCQLLDDDASKVKEEVSNIKDIFDIKTESLEQLKEKGLYEVLDNKLYDSFVEEDSKVLVHPELKKTIKIVYTPLHGTGSTVIPYVLKKNGFDVVTVDSQMINDPAFSSTKSPNPENAVAFEEAIKLGEKVNADLLIATDPDADRVGIGVKVNEGYRLLTGNETGSILIEYLFNALKEQGKLPKKGFLFNTIVTSPIGEVIARNYGVETVSTLTGFKYIGDKAKQIEGTSSKYLFGYEESYGYLIKDHVRDKDSVQSVLLISDMANYYKEKNMTLVDALDEVHKKYGHYYEFTDNIGFPGLDGKSKMRELVDIFRNSDIKEFSGVKVLRKEDYLLSKAINYEEGSEETLTLPKSNVIKYVIENNGFIVIRPSGTEPKIKIYYSVNTKSDKESIELVENLKKDFKNRMKEA